MADKETASNNLYPHFAVKNNKTPNKLYAFPFIGIIIKAIICIPQFIEAMFLVIVFYIVFIINCFVILFTGKYWDTAYDFFLGLMKFCIKIYLFLYGITDKYPGFDLDSNGLFELDIKKPTHPNRGFALPLLGIIARIILLIPYIIFNGVLNRGSGVAVLISWFAVLFQSKYPDSLYEFERDSLRVSLATSTYLTGLSDKYPSFYISMDHKNVKIALIIAGVLLTLFSWMSPGNNRHNNTNPEYNQRYDQSAPQWYTPNNK